jgi:hypothetical protein
MVAGRERFCLSSCGFILYQALFCSPDSSSPRDHLAQSQVKMIFKMENCCQRLRHALMSRGLSCGLVENLRTKILEVKSLFDFTAAMMFMTRIQGLIRTRKNLLSALLAGTVLLFHRTNNIVNGLHGWFLEVKHDVML